MEMIKLNETPLRTSRNFGINNIKLDNIKVPQKIKEFNGLDIVCESKKDIVIEDSSENSNIELKYGMSEDFINQVKNSSNKKIRIEINSKMSNKIELNFKFDDSSSVLIDDIEIIAKEDVKADIVIKYYERENTKEAFHNGVIRTILNKNANINLNVVNLLNERANNFISIENKLEDSSNLNFVIVDFGGKNSVTNYYSDIYGKGANNVLNSIYLGKDDQVFDLNYIGELKGEKSNIAIDVQGALNDNAKKHFKGTIDFKKGAIKASGDENEFCMLLSDKARSIALPMLLCSEEDVEGNHASAAGKVDSKQLFYIMSRGFSYKEAMKLIVKARFNRIIESIKDENLRTEILYTIDARLD